MRLPKGQESQEKKEPVKEISHYSTQILQLQEMDDLVSCTKHSSLYY